MVLTEASVVEQYRKEVADVLASEQFSRTPALSNLLAYLCEKTLVGESNQIKEYTIAVEVFHRRADYDQDADSIVRVEAARLRKRLKDFYAGAGSDHPIQIVIPVGQYVPKFEAREIPQAVAAPADVVPEVVREALPEAVEEKPRNWNLAWLLIPLGLLAITAGIFFVNRVARVPAAAVTAPKTAVLADAVNGLPAGDEVRILCGSDKRYIDHSGKVWLPDQFVQGGIPTRSAESFIWRTQDPEIYRSSRQGDFAYDIPLKPGVYELHLHFAETYYGPEESGGGGEGSRLFSVSANGVALISSLDVVADAGGSRTADTKVITGVQPAQDGLLHLKFSSLHGGRAMLSAIELLPGRSGGRMRPIRILTRDNAYYSNDSRWWSPDMYFKGGQLTHHRELAKGTDDPEMFESERWGNFSYAIPVPPGRYSLTLSFVERCDDSAQQGCIGGEASDAKTRAFNVTCNGKLLLKEIDIAEEAGGARRIVEKKFTGLQANPQGKLLLQFEPIRGYATVTAIEVVPES